jgi:UDP-N-acetylglucosamine--N-acetylmuramyl-(pentapeptide) pyrophosphoryl-undecaprenol N-acetylglucosamine transferase
MNSSGANTPFVAIACGGTGGHLFPGLAVAEQLQQRGCAVTLLISPKDVDQVAVKSVHGMEIVTLPAVGLQNRNYLSFARSFWQSWRAARKLFKSRPPQAVLAMGGFTSAPPVLAARKFGARTFLHESNTIPGRANRFLARYVNEAFVGFPDAASRLRARKVIVTGTPVRVQFQPGYAAPCRAAFGLEPDRPTVLVMGGSQGASGINEMILSTLSLLDGRDWQWLHLSGVRDFTTVQSAYDKRSLDAVVKPFIAKMDLALGAATVAVSRAGASSLAEIAAMRLPSLLVPLPTAADNHQFHNARAFAATGAARLLEQKNATPDRLVALLCELVEGQAARAKIQAALAQWHAPKAAEQIAGIMLGAVTPARNAAAGQPSPAVGSSAGAAPAAKPAGSPGA